MEASPGHCIRACIRLILYLLVTSTFFIHCEGRQSMALIRGDSAKKLRAFKHTFLEQVMENLNLVQSLDSSNTQPYGVSSPFNLPPYDSLSPIPLPPYCVFPPPSSTTPTPIPNPPPAPFYFVPNPPSPATYTPNPPSAVPSPTVFLPPIVYPPPTAPPPPNVAPSLALWCVAKPSVPDPIVQEAMNYACGSGADCDSIQADGPCFQPNTLFAHASFAFNSYWQKTKGAGGTCEFGGTAMLVTVDPSYDGCHFMYI